LAISVLAQTPTVRQAFDEGIQRAQTGIYESAFENYQKAFLLLQNDFSTAEKEFKKALILSNYKSREANHNLQLCKLYK
jgi:hypothetical protein